LFGIPPATAVGTDLLYAAATKSTGTLVHGLNRNIDWRIVGRLAAGSVPMTALTLLALSGFGIYSGAALGVITAVLSGALAATAAVLIFRKRILAFFAAHVGELSPHRSPDRAPRRRAKSIGVDLLGRRRCPWRDRHHPALSKAADGAHRRLRHRPCRAADLVAGLGHWILGSIDWHLLGSLLAGSLPGIVIGSYFSVRVPDAVLRFTLATTLLLVAGKLAL
jgi:uncharacterized membrane protein YfcA